MEKAKLKEVQVVLDCPYCDKEIIIPMSDLVKIIIRSLGRDKEDAQIQA